MTQDSAFSRDIAFSLYSLDQFPSCQNRLPDRPLPNLTSLSADRPLERHHDLYEPLTVDFDRCDVRHLCQLRCFHRSLRGRYIQSYQKAQLFDRKTPSDYRAQSGKEHLRQEDHLELMVQALRGHPSDVTFVYRSYRSEGAAETQRLIPDQRIVVAWLRIGYFSDSVVLAPHSCSQSRFKLYWLLYR